MVKDVLGNSAENSGAGLNPRSMEMGSNCDPSATQFDGTSLTDVSTDETLAVVDTAILPVQAPISGGDTQGLSKNPWPDLQMLQNQVSILCSCFLR